MNMKSRHLGTALASAAIAILPLLWQPSALAGLGGDARSVSVDRQALRGQLQSTSMQQYDVHEISADGSLVREYATPQGKIFAVTWQGSMPPNMQQLFGSYFDQYQTAATASAQVHPGMHRQISIAQPDFVMQSLGRLRAFHGKAFVPSLVPDGVLVADLP
jgi:hypothetical protein